MIEYNFSYTHPHRHYFDIEMRINEHSSSELILQLPAWRPGRYELGNFAKNIQSFKVFDVNDYPCLLYTSPSPRDVEESRMPSSA